MTVSQFPSVGTPPRPIASILTDASRPSLRLLPLSDLHLGINPKATDALVGNRAYLDTIDYVVLLGDQTGCYGTPREYELLDDFVTRLRRPYRAINGNHEFYFEIHDERSGQHGRIWREQPAAAKAAQLERFRRFFGYEHLWWAERNRFGMFIFLGLDDIYSSKVEAVTSSQLASFAAFLQQSRDCPTFVFCHAPLMLDHRLDMRYYDDRTACVELVGELKHDMQTRTAPLFWMSGHIHLHPRHYMFPPYQIAPRVWQVHCPDSWGYSRWLREHVVPKRHEELFSRHLEITADGVRFVTHDHDGGKDTGDYYVSFHTDYPWENKLQRQLELFEGVTESK